MFLIAMIGLEKNNKDDSGSQTLNPQEHRHHRWCDKTEAERTFGSISSEFGNIHR